MKNIQLSIGIRIHCKLYLYQARWPRPYLKTFTDAALDDEHTNFTPNYAHSVHKHAKYHQVDHSHSSCIYIADTLPETSCTPHWRNIRCILKLQAMTIVDTLRCKLISDTCHVVYRQSASNVDHGQIASHTDHNYATSHIHRRYAIRVVQS